MLFALFRQQNDVGEITTDTRSLFVISDMITVLDICNSRPTFLGKGGANMYVACDLSICAICKMCYAISKSCCAIENF